MSKLRKDYENSLWRRFRRFVNGEEYTVETPAKTEGTAVSLTQEKKRQEANLQEPVLQEAKLQEPVLQEAKLQGAVCEPEKKNDLQSQVNERGMRWFQRLYHVISLVVCVLVILVLLMTVAELPRFGSAATPANSNEVAKRYIEKGQEETGAVNIVTGMILDYRAFDTLGESHVLFIAACTVLILLRIDRDKKGRAMAGTEEEDDRRFEPKNDVILQKVAFFLVPCIILFGIYVILNGHISPGGGFSGGAIVGAGLILYLNAFGFQKTERFFTYKTFSVVSLCSLLFYSVAKCYSFFCGANHFESGIPMGTPGDILSSGLILPLNICVGCVVACTMYAFYAIFRKGGL